MPTDKESALSALLAKQSAVNQLVEASVTRVLTCVTSYAGSLRPWERRAVELMVAEIRQSIAGVNSRPLPPWDMEADCTSRRADVLPFRPVKSKAP